MILIKRISLIILITTLISCGFKELNTLYFDNSSIKKIENPYFNNNTDYNYVAKIDLMKKKIDGIISIKKIDSIYHRIVFTSAFGYKFLDIEISKNTLKWNLINPEIDKKYIRNLLEDNLSTLIYGNNEINVKSNLNNKQYYKSKKRDKEITYIVDSKKKLIGIYKEKKGVKKIRISYKNIRKNIAENIIINNYNPSFKINLEFHKY